MTKREDKLIEAKKKQQAKHKEEQEKARKEELERREREIATIKQSIEGLADALQVNVDFKELEDKLTNLDKLEEVSKKLDKIDDLAKDIGENVEIPDEVSIKGFADLWSAHEQSEQKLLNELDTKTAQKFADLQEYLEQLEQTIEQGQRPEDYTPVRIVEGGGVTKLKFVETINSNTRGGGAPKVVGLDDTNEVRINPRKEDGHGSDNTTPSFVQVTDPKTLFSSLETSSRTPLIELKSTYGLSALRDIEETVNTGSVTNDFTEYNLSTGATTGSSAILSSAERGRYIPGSQAQAGIGVRVDETFTGTSHARWGYYDDDNGFGFGVDSGGVFTFVRREGTDNKTYQSNWNGDKLDGNGASGLTLSLSNGNIFQIDFSWYGYGIARFSVVMDTGDNKQDVIVVHRFSPSGQTSIEDPNLPIRAEIDNGDTTNDLDLFVGGRQYGVYNDYNPNVRVTSQYRLARANIDTTFLPLVSFRRKTDFIGVSVKLEGLDLVTDQNLIYQLRLDGSLTGASYQTPTDHSASETAVEADISATAITGGEVVYEGFVTASGSGSNSTGSLSTNPINLDLPAQQPLTLCVRRFSSTGATASATLRVREEW